MPVVKKTIELDEVLIRKLRKILEVDTDKEAVNLAMRIVTDEDELVELHRNLAGKVQIEDVFR